MTTLAGPKVMLMGPSGTGKTFAIATLVEWGKKNGLEVFVLFTEQGLETILGAWADKGQPVPDNLHWHTIEVKALSLAQLTETANKVGLLSYESIAKISDPNRSKNNAFEAVLKSLSDFPDDRTGKKYGAVDSWGADKFLIIDGLSELANAATKMVIGNKPTMSMPDYGVAQNNLMNFLRLCTQCKCGFGMIAHVTREKDEITGGIKLMVRAIGNAIAGDIPPLFSDVIYTVREGASFYWDTANATVDVKTRNLPIAAKITPDFGLIMEKWKARANVK